MPRHSVPSYVVSAIASAVVILLASTPTSGETAVQAYVKSWAGARVVVKQPLYTLVYTERGRVGKTYRGKRIGLTVTTPSSGTYFQFDGQYSEPDIIDTDPDRLMKRISDTYRRTTMLSDSPVQKIEPLLLVRLDPGVELMVKSVQVEFDRVRVTFVKGDGSDEEIATGLAIKWPAPLSAALSERHNLDALIGRFVDAADSHR
jgi:hypothetical protein